jgi:hypothetical protein
MRQLLVIIATLLLVISSCKKTINAVSDYPTITITSPKQGNTYKIGGLISIKGSASASSSDDAHLLHELSLTITNMRSQEQLFSTVLSVHDLETYTIDTTVALTSASIDSMRLDAIVVNHLEKQTKQSVTFRYQP